MEFEPAHERKHRQACVMYNLARAFAARDIDEGSDLTSNIDLSILL